MLGTYLWYNGYMEKKVSQTVEDRRTKKIVSIATDEKSVDNLEHQIALYSNSIEKKRAGIEQKLDEVKVLDELMDEAVELEKKCADILEYTNFLRAKYDAIEWKPDLAWEEKIESSDYAEKTAERFGYVDRLTEIEKSANKIYYRR